MDELVAVGAAAEDVDGGALGHELEEDGHDAQPAAAEDGAGPHDRYVEPGRRRLPAQHLGLERGPAVGLERSARRVLGDGVRVGDAEHRARRRSHHLGHAGVACGHQHVGGPTDVDRVEQRPVLGQGHLGDVVQHDVDALAGGPHRAPVAHVGHHHLEGARPGAVRSGLGRLTSSTRTVSPRARVRSTSTVPT